jgi:hypothetical protein
VVVRLDRPVLADLAGQVWRGGVRAGQAGDGVDGLAGCLADSGVLPPAGRRALMAWRRREVQAADVGGPQGAGLRGLRPCPVSRVELPAAPPGSPSTRPTRFSCPSPTRFLIIPRPAQRNPRDPDHDVDSHDALRARQARDYLIHRPRPQPPSRRPPSQPGAPDQPPAPPKTRVPTKDKKKKNMLVGRPYGRCPWLSVISWTPAPARTDV